MSNHTPEPWRVGRPFTVVSDTPVPEMGGSDAVEYYGGHLIGESIIEENARRIVACVNACAGMTNPAEEIAELKQQRDELMEALDAFSNYIHAEQCSTDGPVHYSDGQLTGLAIMARKAIAKAKGGAS